MAAREAVGRGVHISSRPPTGYRRDENGRLHVDEPAASAVKEVFRRRALGSSWAELARYFDEFGVRPPTGNPHWSKVGVAGLIKNPVYLGHARGGDAVNDHAHEPLVTRGRVRRRSVGEEIAAAASRRVDRNQGDAGRAGTLRRLRPHPQDHRQHRPQDRRALSDLSLRPGTTGSCQAAAAEQPGQGTGRRGPACRLADPRRAGEATAHARPPRPRPDPARRPPRPPRPTDQRARTDRPARRHDPHRATGGCVKEGAGPTYLTARLVPLDTNQDLSRTSVGCHPPEHGRAPAPARSLAPPAGQASHRDRPPDRDMPIRRTDLVAAAVVVEGQLELLLLAGKAEEVVRRVRRAPRAPSARQHRRSGCHARARSALPGHRHGTPHSGVASSRARTSTADALRLRLPSFAPIPCALFACVLMSLAEPNDR
jgi:hypothetical protein